MRRSTRVAILFPIAFLLFYGYRLLVLLGAIYILLFAWRGVDWLASWVVPF